jgi:hypothetical protein
VIVRIPRPGAELQPVGLHFSLPARGDLVLPRLQRTQGDRLLSSPGRSEIAATKMLSRRSPWVPFFLAGSGRKPVRLASGRLAVEPPSASQALEKAGPVLDETAARSTGSHHGAPSRKP